MRILLSLAMVALFAQPSLAQTIGEVLPPWSPGTLDIHHINTGKGDSAFLILPDGTTLLVDAGASDRLPPRITPPKPDGSRQPGEWIARYIRHMLAHDASPAIDYGFNTHFHGDHLGSLGPQSRTSESGQYKLTGFTEVGENVPIRKMLDRGWPNYNYPQPLDDPMIANYSAFLKWQIAHAGMEVEQLEPGRNDQIVLLREPQKYPNFEIRNIAANGEIWTGVGSDTRRHFPPLQDASPDEYPTENMCSMAIRLSYGPFDYYTGGDMPGLQFDGTGPAWWDVETPVAQAVGPVEACVLNHHGNRDSTNPFFVSSLRPQVFIVPVWSANHPGEDVAGRLYSTRLYPGPRDVFATNLFEENRIVIGANLERFKSMQGHILIRVAPGGESFQVIILDDSHESYKVKAIHGPYLAR